MGAISRPGRIEANVTMPASDGESYSASANSTIATPNIVWATRASCMDATTRPSWGTAKTAR